MPAYRVIPISDPEVSESPRAKYIFRVMVYVQSWRRAFASLTVLDTIELDSASAEEASVPDGDLVSDEFEQARRLLVEEAFVFFVQKLSRKTDLQAEMANYDSYRRFERFHLWLKESPEIRYEFGDLQYFTTNPGAGPPT